LIKLVAIDGVGRLRSLYVFLNPGFSSYPSTGLTRFFYTGGFGIYTGNFSNVHCVPIFGGFDGLKGLSCNGSYHAFFSADLGTNLGGIIGFSS
jgi:hypothetical protein